MKLFNKLGIIAASVLSLGLIQVNSAEAASFDRSDFNPDATVVDFDGASGNTFTDGNLSVTNGFITNTSTVFSPAVTDEGYYDGNNGALVRLDFLEEVSALGMDFATRPSLDMILSVFDKSNNLIESITLDTDSLPKAPSNNFNPIGFIVLDVGSNLISYATIDTPAFGDEFIIDNVVYQSAAQSVPEPASMLGILAVTSLGAASVKRKFAKAKEAQNA